MIRRTLAGFCGLEHRIQLVGSVNGVDFFDDSKATTVDATKAALRSMEKSVILIAGGRNKKSDFTPAGEEIKERVKTLIAIGEAKAQIKDELSDFTKIIDAVDMHDAVKIAKSIAEEGDAVLLSPMCASFDQFSCFEERGKMFKAIFEQLTAEAKPKTSQKSSSDHLNFLTFL